VELGTKLFRPSDVFDGLLNGSLRVSHRLFYFKEKMIMRTLKALAVLLAFGCYVPFVLAADASVAISSPADGAKLSRTAQTKINYEVTPGPKGDHTHLYVDDKEVAVLRQLKGSYTLESLASGKHEICIKVVSKGHTPIGVQQCIKVSVE